MQMYLFGLFIFSNFIDGETYNVGAVSAIRRVKNAAGVARAVLDHTSHTMLAGELAAEFAYEMGFANESLYSNQSIQQHETWLSNNCQPNFWVNVSPDPTKNCGPYTPLSSYELDSNDVLTREQLGIGEDNHDTIGMVVIDGNNRKAAGTTTNGMRYKISGRVGDSPVPGAGAYSGDAGGAAATGDGDIMMRFLPTYQGMFFSLQLLLTIK